VHDAARERAAALTDGSAGLWVVGGGMVSPPLELPPMTKSNDIPELGTKLSSKIASVIEMLSRQQGATIAELIDATGWQAHTVRAALTGLRKKGHDITRGSRDSITCYLIEAA